MQSPSAAYTNSVVHPKNPNVQHFAFLLDAELQELDGKVEDARESFRASIGRAEERGLLHDAAKAHQRFAEHYMRQITWSNCKREDNLIKAHEHMNRAIALYEDWGALAVAAKLRSKYSPVSVDQSEELSDED